MLAATALGLTVALTGSTVHAVPAADPGRGRPGVQEADPVEGRNAKAAPRPSDPSRKSVVTRLDKAVLPAGGSREVAVAASPKPVEVGGLPVTVAAVPSAKASGAKSARTAASAGPAQVRVDVLSPARAKDLSAGAVLRIQRSDESADGAKVRLSVDYSAFEDAYGGSYGARLRLVQLPACAEFAAPGSKACPGTGTPLATVNDPVANTASAEVTAAPADPDGTSAMAARGPRSSRSPPAPPRRRAPSGRPPLAVRELERRPLHGWLLLVVPDAHGAGGRWTRALGRALVPVAVDRRPDLHDEQPGFLDR
ncbi:hypothetical protein ACFQ60_32730 [Streptomyces zhihengii]